MCMVFMVWVSWVNFFLFVAIYELYAIFFFLVLCSTLIGFLPAFCFVLCTMMEEAIATHDMYLSEKNHTYYFVHYTTMYLMFKRHISGVKKLLGYDLSALLLFLAIYYVVVIGKRQFVGIYVWLSDNVDKRSMYILDFIFANLIFCHSLVIVLYFLNFFLLQLSVKAARQNRLHQHIWTLYLIVSLLIETKFSLNWTPKKKCRKVSFFPPFVSSLFCFCQFPLSLPFSLLLFLF